MCFSSPSAPKMPDLPTPPVATPPPPPVKESLVIIPKKKKKKRGRKSLRIDRTPGQSDTTGSSGLQVPK